MEDCTRAAAIMRSVHWMKKDEASVRWRRIERKRVYRAWNRAPMKKKDTARRA
jgi:hypothetical protein